MQQAWDMRSVAAADAEQIAAHGHYAMPNVERQAGYAAWVGTRIESGIYIGWFAVIQGGVVGGAGAVLLDWGPTRANPSGRMARIVNVFTDDSWRRQGIARSLVNRVLAQCEALGVREFNLGATADARPLYASLGFESYPAEMRRRTAGRNLEADATVR
ncbi:GNAT family N-acetyltransferase [Roseateles cellulosilyticus]|uniref:GNAT family N-acetyltransferase n=1 Tax=Pelomonas cellulosilytica TaxID=2906762 RepID=A0ABS8XRB2_9BURK|nr:GNAT family N-acetyltransferase [Pelomonas sp. P8]MCE4555257.1 GNAT family N-acetyltransferase [Pelomonas sp. P8]